MNYKMLGYLLRRSSNAGILPLKDLEMFLALNLVKNLQQQYSLKD